MGAAAVEDEIALAETETETESETEIEAGNWSASEVMEPRSRGRRGGQGGSVGLKRKASAGSSAPDPAGAGDAAAQFNQLHT